MDPIRFRSKVDGWLAAVLLISAVVSVLAVASVAVAESPLFALVISPMLLVSVVLPVWLLRSTEYRIDSSELHVRSGPFSWRVPLSEIRAISPTRNPLSSPALSLDRLRIDYGRRNSIMVSPKEKEAFIAELRKRVPAI
ncbi:MAG: PH domain-containing protein [Thermoanaerobaculia bacterium]